MKLSSEMLFHLTRINTALLQGNNELLASCFEGVDLNKLLCEENIAEVRARGKNVMTIFLTTLAVSNDISPQRAQIWLDCYQSIAKGTLLNNLQKSSDKNFLKLIVTSIIKKIDLNINNLKSCKGSSQNTVDGFELLIDYKKWSSAVTFLEHLSKQKYDSKLWMQLAKSLINRHELYVDESGIPHTDVDYLKISNLYDQCIAAAKKAHAPVVIDSLKNFKAKYLEIAREYTKSIELLQELKHEKDSLNTKINIARCYCRDKKIPLAIQTLDSAIAHHKMVNSALKSDAYSISGIEEPARPDEKKFNVANASKALADLASVLNKVDLKFFLVSGTLLGYEREGKLLDHDKDIDIGIIGWEQQYECCMALQNSSLFTISVLFLKGKNSYYVPIRHNLTGMWIDIFFYHEIDNKIVTGVDFFFGYRQTFAFTPFELKPINFLGVDMHIPENSDLNLQENFGNWRVSDPSYLSHLESPSTVNKGGMEHMLGARIHALSHIAKSKPLKLRKTIHILREYKNSPWAMDEALIQILEKYCDHLDFLENTKTPETTTEEVCCA